MNGRTEAEGERLQLYSSDDAAALVAGSVLARLIDDERKVQ